MPDVIIPEDGSLTPEVAKALGIDEKFTNISQVGVSQKEAQTKLGQVQTELDTANTTITGLQDDAEANAELLLQTNKPDDKKPTPPADSTDPLAGVMAEFDADPAGTFRRSMTKMAEHSAKSLETAKEEWRAERAAEKAEDAEKAAKKEVGRQGKVLMDKFVADGKSEEWGRLLPLLTERLGKEITPETLKSNTVERVCNDILGEEKNARTAEEEKQWLADQVRANASLGGGATPISTGRKSFDDMTEEELAEYLVKVEGVKGLPA